MNLQALEELSFSFSWFVSCFWISTRKVVRREKFIQETWFAGVWGKKHEDVWFDEKLFTNFEPINNRNESWIKLSVSVVRLAKLETGQKNDR